MYNSQSDWMLRARELSHRIATNQRQSPVELRRQYSGYMIIWRDAWKFKWTGPKFMKLFCFLFPGNTAGALQTIKKHQVLPVSKGFKAVKKTRGADIWKT